ncbi:MAG TPA: 50S ribosomal protein L11 methyltransferase [Cyanobacteria bacterium UBA8803]|nr:50S ribosomal protein L11 methyltransferase [Cyanobacteria bacterium UBA9273]HBL61246.1 50S ribosomal protein L11 methyltransferase [Cyanobacteria bacterium UBA8803]
MAWMELSIDATHEAVDWVSTLLAANYIDEVRIGKYAEPELGSPSDLVKLPWAFNICLYIPYDTRASARVAEIINQLSPLHRIGLTAAPTEAVVEQKPEPAGVLSPLIHRIGQRFVVLAADAPYHFKAADDIPLRLKTSPAFGSGLHPTTIVSLQLLERYVMPGMNALDLGSGSGILSVAMAKLGAEVLALDNDTIAVQSSRDTVGLNGVAHQVTVMAGSLGCGSDLGHWMGKARIENVATIQATATFDLIVTNILARVHIALADDFRRALRQTDAGAPILITAGFTTTQEEEVATALTMAGFEAIDCQRFNEWVALAYRL